MLSWAERFTKLNLNRINTPYACHQNPHCLGLDLNGLLTRRNFWSIPGMLENYMIPKWKEFLKKTIRRSWNGPKLLMFQPYKESKMYLRHGIWQKEKKSSPILAITIISDISIMFFPFFLKIFFFLSGLFWEFQKYPLFT